MPLLTRLLRRLAPAEIAAEGREVPRPTPDAETARVRGEFEPLPRPNVQTIPKNGPALTYVEQAAGQFTLPMPGRDSKPVVLHEHALTHLVRHDASLDLDRAAIRGVSVTDYRSFDVAGSADHFLWATLRVRSDGALSGVGERDHGVAMPLRVNGDGQLSNAFAHPEFNAALRGLGIEVPERGGLRAGARLLQRGEYAPVEAKTSETHALKTAAFLSLAQRASLPVDSRREFLEQVGLYGSKAALPVLETLARGANEPRVAEVARTAMRDVQNAQRMSLAFASWEVRPFSGTGGLGNVMEELPKMLAKMGHRVSVFTPLHPSIDRGALHDTGVVVDVPGPKGPEPFRMWTTRSEGVDYYLLHNDTFFSKDRPGLYGPTATTDYADNAERFDYFGAALPEAISRALEGKAPDHVQLNDYHTGTAAYHLQNDPQRRFDQSTVTMAVHNGSQGYFQGDYSPAHLPNLRIDPKLFYLGGPAEAYGKLNFLKLGLVLADGVIPVSQRYAEELQDEKADTGAGLQGVYRELAIDGKLRGNLNGIRTDVWNSATDKFLLHRFQPGDLAGKALAKADLQAQYGLADGPNAPLFGMVSRMTDQKGFDEAVRVIEHAAATHQKLRFVVVGMGEPQLEEKFRALQKAHPDLLVYDDKFTQEKEHRLLAGSDFLFMPSKFEPCGLPQMYALRYTTVPVVRGVGGLHDSIQEYDPAHGTGNGFKFGPGSRGGSDAFTAVRRALDWYLGTPQAKKPLLDNAISSDFSWETTAAPEQVAIYREFNALNAPRRWARAKR